MTELSASAELKVGHGAQRLGGFRNLSWLSRLQTLLTLQLLAFDFQQLAIQFCAEKNGDATDVEPEHQCDHRADGSVGPVVVSTMRDVNIYAGRDQNPQNSPDDCPG